MDKFANAAKSIDRFFTEHGPKVPKFAFHGVILNTDVHQLPVSPPSHFSLERRAGFPFSQKIFFSQAPVPTKDHLKILEKLDSTLH